MRLTLSKVFIALALIGSSLHAYAEETDFTCATGVISQVNFNKTKLETTPFCYNQKRNALRSKNCLSKTCMAFASSSRFTASSLLSPMGKPGFKVCRALNGKPELITFFVESKPYKLDRCLFKDGSFVDTGTLVSFFLDREDMPSLLSSPSRDGAS